MLTIKMCEKLLEVAKYYNEDLKNEIIRIRKGDEFHCKIIPTYNDQKRFELMFTEEHKKDYFYDNIAKYLKNNLGLSEAAYMLSSFEEIFSFLHEIGHIIGEYKIGYNKKYYNIYKSTVYNSCKDAFYEYRNISSEKFADKFAVDVLNKYTAEIGVIIGEYNNIEEARKEVNFWNGI